MAEKIVGRKVGTLGADFFAKLAEKAKTKSLGGAWKGEKDGDCIAGIVVKVEDVKGKGKKKVQERWTLDTADGEQLVYVSTVLENAAERVGGVKEGDAIAIAFRGMKDSSTKGHQPMRLYSIEKGEVK